MAERDKAKAKSVLKPFHNPVRLVDLNVISQYADVIVECLPPECFSLVADPCIADGRVLVATSVSALLSRQDLIEKAERTGSRILVPSGALIGLDGISAVVESGIDEVTLITRKPPASLATAPYVKQQGLRLDRLTAPLKLFEGSARDGAAGFPANLNIAAALSLAGVGPDRTRIQIWADPTIDRNIHVVEVKASCANFRIEIVNSPSSLNPRSAQITPYSVIASLRRLVSTIQIGS